MYTLKMAVPITSFESRLMDFPQSHPPLSPLCHNILSFPNKYKKMIKINKMWILPNWKLNKYKKIYIYKKKKKKKLQKHMQQKSQCINK